MSRHNNLLLLAAFGPLAVNAQYYGKFLLECWLRDFSGRVPNGGAGLGGCWVGGRRLTGVVECTAGGYYGNCTFLFSVLRILKCYGYGDGREWMRRAGAGQAAIDAMRAHTLKRLPVVRALLGRSNRGGRLARQRWEDGCPYWTVPMGCRGSEDSVDGAPRQAPSHSPKLSR